MADPQIIQQQTEYQTGFAPQLAPYGERLLGASEGQIFDYKRDPVTNQIIMERDEQGNLTGMPAIQGFKPYMQYQGERFAQFSPLQQQAFAGAQAMEAAPQLADASALAGTAGLRALQAGTYGPMYYTPQSFTQQGIAGGFMSPYMQNVVEFQQREAQRQADIAATARGQKYARAGAFGGARQAIENAEAQRNLATQMGGIQAQGLQQAYQQAQQQFNAEQQARLQAQLANQQAGITVGGQNLGAALGVQQLGAQQGLQAALANQQAQMQAQQQAEQSRQFGYGQQMAGAGMGAQYGQAAAQLGEQSRQYGAGLGLQGLQAAMGAAGQLGQLGQSQFGQNMAINQLQQQYGGLQQQQAQNILGAQYQDFLNYQNYPYKQLGFMSDILRGAPLSQTGAAVYQQPPSAVSQLAGLGTAAFGASKLFGMKDGGAVEDVAYREKPAGLADLAIYNMGV